jgi:hypothetical protein
MKSLMRMSKPPFNTNRREDANAAAGIAAGPLSSAENLTQKRNRKVSLPLTYRSVF